MVGGRRTAFALAWQAVTVAPVSAWAAEPDRLAFFETRIRPVLAARCYECHSEREKKSKGGLRLDSGDALLAGGSTGAVVVPGAPEESRLVRAIRYQDEDLRMPPEDKDRLSAEQVADFEAWIEMGARVPRVSPRSDKPENHWAFRPPARPSVPRVRDGRWSATAVDRFVLAKLEGHGMRPAPPADKRTLIRRASFDLTGLAPTPEEVAAFEADPSPRAFERVVDRLLASPRYGERWGRIWLDVARYADTVRANENDTIVLEQPHTYRDWVIRAFNEDLPYDRFLIEQIAADQLDLGDDTRPLAALGFLTVGRRMGEDKGDFAMEDRIDVVTRGLLGLTVTCARCHDHKHDPIPAADYYSLYGVFASTKEATPFIVAKLSEARPLLDEYEASQRDLDGFRKTVLDKATEPFRTRERIAEYLLAAEGLHRGDERQKLGRNAGVLDRWAKLIGGTKASHSAVFAPWNALAAVPDVYFAAGFADFMAHAAKPPEPGKAINPLVRQALERGRPACLVDVADIYGSLLAEFDQKRSKSRTQSTDADVAEIEDVFRRGNTGVFSIPTDKAKDLLDARQQARFFELERRFGDVARRAPPKAMALADLPKPVAQRIFVRGNRQQLGAEVPRQFLAVLAGPGRRPFENGSGRLELARAIARPENPLTARVMVNRVWLHHFGEGLVATPSDFGTQGEPPSHPELLDHLARWFTDNGWSVKKLHRLLMLSSSYRQVSSTRAFEKKDPENRLLWRMNRRRLDFEALRDGLLFAAGQLDPAMGGPSVGLAPEIKPGSQVAYGRPVPLNWLDERRRTIYLFVDRMNLPSVWRTFDFPSPELHSPRRHLTTAPQQALFFMNSPFAMKQAERLIERGEIRAQPKAHSRIHALYRLIFQRPPAADEVRLGLKVLGESREEVEASWTSYVQALLASNEFAFVD